MIYYILLKIATETNETKYSIPNAFWKTYCLIIFVGTIIMKYLILTSRISSTFTHFRIAYGETLEIFTGIVIYIVFSDIKLIVVNNRTLLIKRLWVTVSIILIINGIIKLIPNAIKFIYVYFIKNNNPTTSFDNIISTTELISTFGILGISIAVTIFAIYYPESLLISHIQISKIGEFYQKIQTMLEDDYSESSPIFQTEEFIIDYLRSIKKDLDIQSE